MRFSRDSLLQALQALQTQIDHADAPTRYVVAFSGGLDSTVLLHALASTADVHGIPLLAVHIDHGLQSGSRRWAEQCEELAARLDVEFRAARVQVDTSGDQGIEAAARDARYAALARIVEQGDWVLSAHHQEDQAETLLLNLMRGGGPAGLAGIAASRRFVAGWLVRPLLSFSQAALRDYAARHDLSWIDDPSNCDLAFDRNFLRHEILPAIESRWPGAAKRLHRSSVHASEAASLLHDLAAIDAKSVADRGDRPNRLNLAALCSLPPARQRNVLRFALRQSGLTTPSAAQLQRVLDEVVDARADAEPVLKWRGVDIRRYRGRLYLLATSAEAEAEAMSWQQQPRLDLGAGNGFLQLQPAAELGLDPQLVERGLTLRYRRGGEKIKLPNQPHTKSLKNLLQEEGVVPWMRDRIPLLYAGQELVAVADLWLADAAAQRPGTAIRWLDRPPIH